MSEVQAEAIRKFHTQSPVRPDEMLYLGLRSLFQFTWSEPESEHDLRFAAAYDFVLKQILARPRLEDVEGLLAPSSPVTVLGANGLPARDTRDAIRER